MATNFRDDSATNKVMVVVSGCNVSVIKPAPTIECPIFAISKPSDGRHTWADTRKRHNRGCR